MANSEKEKRVKRLRKQLDVLDNAGEKKTKDANIFNEVTPHENKNHIRNLDRDPDPD